MQQLDFQPIPGARRASSNGRPSTALPIRHGEHGEAYLKPLPRADGFVVTTDACAAFNEGLAKGLGDLVDSDSAEVVQCDEPTTFSPIIEHPAYISVAAFDNALPMAYIDRKDLKKAGKRTRNALRQRIARDYVLRCWLGDSDRNAGGYVCEIDGGGLTGRLSAFDAAASFTEPAPRVDIGDWPKFFADAAVGDRTECVEARQDMARRIVGIKRAQIEKIMKALPARVRATRPNKPVVDYLLERQQTIAELFL